MPLQNGEGWVVFQVVEQEYVRVSQVFETRAEAEAERTSLQQSGSYEENALCVGKVRPNDEAFG